MIAGWLFWRGQQLPGHHVAGLLCRELRFNCGLNVHESDVKQFMVERISAP